MTTPIASPFSSYGVTYKALRTFNAIPTVLRVRASAGHRVMLEEGALHQIEEFVATTLDELDLPVTPHLELQAVENQPPPASTFDVHFEGKRVTLWGGERRNAQTLATEVSESLLCAREAFVTDAVVRQLWDDWFPTRRAFCDQPQFLATLRELIVLLVRHGIRVKRAQPAIAQWLPGNMSPQLAHETFEKVFDECETAGLWTLVSPEIHRLFVNNTDAVTAFQTLADHIVEALFYELGIAFSLEAPQEDAKLSDSWFRVRLNDLSWPPLKALQSNEILVNQSVAGLQSPLTGVETVNPATGAENAIVNKDVAGICKDLGLTTWGPEEHMALAALRIARRYAALLLTDKQRAVSMSMLEKAFPNLVGATSARFDGDLITRVLRLLLDEGISINDLRGVFEGLVSINGVTTAASESIVFVPHSALVCPVSPGRDAEQLDAADYADCVRVARARYISHKYARGGRTIFVYLLDPEIEKRLRDPAPLTEDERVKLLDAIADEILDRSSTFGDPLMLTTHDVRRRLRCEIAGDFPHISVLSYQELVSTSSLHPLARISYA